MEMLRVSKNKILFSVPDVRWFLQFDIRVFSSKNNIRHIYNFPRFTNRRLAEPKSPEDHHWEIGRPGFPVKTILNELNSINNIVLERHYRIPSNPIHHIFVIRKDQ